MTERAKAPRITRFGVGGIVFGPRRVLVVDDHQIVREGVRVVLRHSVFRHDIGEADTAAAALEMLHQESWDVVILDLGLPDRSGLEVLAEIKAEFPQLPVVVLSGLAEFDSALQSFRAGASAYVNKASTTEQLLHALDEVIAGKRYCPPDLAERLTAELTAETSRRQLTKREREIVRLFAVGTPAAEIARTLGISAKTVSTHRANILAKLGLRTNAELIRYAVLRGLDT